MGTAVSKKKNLRNDAISSVAAKVRAARAFGEYLSHTHPENRNGSAHLLCETVVGADPESPSITFGPNNNNNHFHSFSHQSDTNATKGSEVNPESSLVNPPLDLLQPPPPTITISSKPAQLALERSFSAEEDQQKCVECTLQPARVYTITTQHGMLMSSGRGSKESLELDVLKERSGSSGVGSKGGSGNGDQHLHSTLNQPSTSPSSTSSSPTQFYHASSCRGNHDHRNHHHHGNHHHHTVSGTNVPSSSGGGSGAGGSSGSKNQQQLNVASSDSHYASHHHGHHHHLSQPPLQTSVSTHNIRSWGEGGKGEAECSTLACESCSSAPSRSQGSLDLESVSREAGKQHRRLERMWSVDRMTGLEREDNSWFPKENMFSFQTATTTIQA
ncbi:hypothetical protein LDENG_00005460 [Lucifuga dentata]|nr:hypothetical protein LDENG_00005460 [Lucifuga dentata]